MNNKVATMNSGGVKRTIRHIFDIVNQKTPLNSYGEMTMDDFNDVMTSLCTRCVDIISSEGGYDIWQTGYFL